MKEIEVKAKINNPYGVIERLKQLGCVISDEIF